MEPRDLIKAMKAAGMTQANISAVTGIAQTTISKIETGARTNVLLSNYRLLESAHAKHVADVGAAAPTNG